MTATATGRPPELADLPALAKPAEVAAALRVSKNAIYDLANRSDNPMPHIRLGPHQLRIVTAGLIRWLGLTESTDV